MTTSNSRSSLLEWNPMTGYSPEIVSNRASQTIDVCSRFIDQALRDYDRESCHDEVLRTMPNIPSLYRGNLQRTNLVIPQAADAVFSGIGQY